MSSLIVLLAILSTAAAFTTVGTRNAVSKMQMSTEFSKSIPFIKKPKNLDGLTGNFEFDPLGLAEYVDVKWMVEAEYKHGRIAMLATVGWLVQSAGIHLPSPDGLYDVANPIDAFFHVGPSPMAQIFIFIGALESINHEGKLSISDMHKDSTREVAQFSLPIYGASQLKGKSPALVEELKLKELQNGRLAMLAIGGMVHHTIIAGSETFGAFPNPNLWSLY